MLLGWKRCATRRSDQHCAGQHAAPLPLPCDVVPAKPAGRYVQAGWLNWSVAASTVRQHFNHLGVVQPRSRRKAGDRAPPTALAEDPDA